MPRCEEGGCCFVLFAIDDRAEGYKCHEKAELLRSIVIEESCADLCSLCLSVFELLLDLYNVCFWY